MYTGDDLERHRVALEELESLDHQRRQLQLSIESLRSSPAALSVLKLQHELLELQKRELEQLEKQVCVYVCVCVRARDISICMCARPENVYVHKYGRLHS